MMDRPAVGPAVSRVAGSGRTAPALRATKAMKKSQIFKIQVPLFTSDQEPKALVYNEDRSIINQFPITKGLMKLMRGELKQFWHCDLIPDPKVKGAFQIQMDRKAKWQDW